MRCSHDGTVCRHHTRYRRVNERTTYIGRDTQVISPRKPGTRDKLTARDQTVNICPLDLRTVRVTHLIELALGVLLLRRRGRLL